MRIAITLLSGVSYGASTYCMNFIPALARADRINEYHIFAQRDHPILQVVHQDNFIFHKCNFSIRSVFTRSIWEQFVFPFEAKKRKIDIVFTAKNLNILFAPCKTIIAIQNIEPFYYYGRGENHWRVNMLSWLLKQFTKISMKKADRIMVVSQSNKEHVERFFPNVSSKLVLSRNGNSVIKKTARSYAPEEPFLLTASKFIVYANQLSLIEGYSVLYRERKDVPSLWFAGGIFDKAYFKKILSYIKESGLTDKVRILGFIPHERLVELYSQALAFIFPSTMETCPMTLIEAMACGIPIATSNVGSMPEVCQDAALYFDPFDKRDIANKINMLLTDSELRKNLTIKSLKRCQYFSWDKIAAEMVEVFKTT